jgi:RimJ/RimL family protein N-acetyltransferase
MTRPVILRPLELSDIEALVSWSDDEVFRARAGWSDQPIQDRRAFWSKHSKSISALLHDEVPMGATQLTGWFLR